jgi:hypothetical protein
MGVIFDEDGTSTVKEWPIRPHCHIVDELNTEFVTQFKYIYASTPHYPLWINEGTNGIVTEGKTHSM